jgi:hypothetical protein
MSFEGICKNYIIKSSNEGNIFPEEACIEILSKITNIFVNNTLEVHSLLKKKQYVEALDKVKLLCNFEEKLSKEIFYLDIFYQIGRKEFKEAIDNLKDNINESKILLKQGLIVLQKVNKTVFPIILCEYLEK